jgi:hypothetical protein
LKIRGSWSLILCWRNSKNSAHHPLKPIMHLTKEVHQANS